MSKVLYFVGLFSTFFPVIILPIPIVFKFLIAMIIFAFTMFLPVVATFFETILWIIGIVILCTTPFDFVTIIGVVAFIIWLISTIAFIIYLRHPGWRL